MLDPLFGYVECAHRGVDRYWYALGDRIGDLAAAGAMVGCGTLLRHVGIAPLRQCGIRAHSTVQLEKLNDLISSAAKGMDAVLRFKRNE
jgi:hypothetical protein